MVIVEVKNGDLLNATEKYIAHQCNCNTIKSHGLAQSLHNKFPWADVYSVRPKKSRNKTSEPDEPGTIMEMNSGDDDLPVILAFMGQWCPGIPNKYARFYPDTYEDTKENREKWFQECLNILDEKEEYEVVAMPYRIGCGYAGGSWKKYKQMLEKCKTKIVIYKLE